MNMSPGSVCVKADGCSRASTQVRKTPDGHGLAFTSLSRDTIADLVVFWEDLIGEIISY